MVARAWHDLSGKVAVVYGASRGLGREVAVQLAAAGATVACGARGIDGLRRTAARIEAAGGEAMAAAVDVREEESISEFTARVIDRHDQLDIVVFCAGIMHVAPALRTTTEDWERVLRVNLTGAFSTARDAAARMKSSGGRIILFGTAFVGRVLPLTVAYTVSKGGLHQLVRSLAAEWARYRITVNGVAPGYFETEMSQAVLGNEDLRSEILSRIPLRRLGDPAEIGPLVHYLASDASAFMTGSILRIDGGQSLNIS